MSENTTKPKKKKAAAKRPGRMKETLFPLPKNRTRQPTDAETLLHALCVGIRDHATHAELRGMISHLPRIMNRANPYNATQAENVALTERVGKLERVCLGLLGRVKRQTAKDKALQAELSPKPEEQTDGSTEQKEQPAEQAETA